MLIAENKVKIYNNEKIDGESLKMEIGLFKKFPNTSHLEMSDCRLIVCLKSNPHGYISFF